MYTYTRMCRSQEIENMEAKQTTQEQQEETAATIPFTHFCTTQAGAQSNQ